MAKTVTPSDVFDKTEETDAPVEKPVDDPKCANHPQRKAITYTHGGVVLSLCDECTPPWFKTD